MRPSRSFCAAAVLGALILSAQAGALSAKSSKKQATAPVPAAPTAPAAASADDARIKKLAKILRATDRRIVDDDILGLLGDSDAAVRAAAARGLGQIAEKAALKPRLQATSDADPSVREAAERLQAMAADTSPIVRRAVASALGMIHAAASRDALAKLLADPDLTVRANADLAAWKFADPAPLLEEVIGNSGSQDPRVRSSACYALARLGSAGAAPASSGAAVGQLSEADVRRVRAALAVRAGDKEPEVRMQVARGLAKPASPAEVAVVGTLTGDRDPRVRVNAVKSLGYPGTPLRPYLDRAVADISPAVGRTAVEALGKACGGDVEAKLKFLLPKYIESWRREAVLTSLAQCNPVEIPAIVEGLLLNPDPVMRLAALPMAAAHSDAKGARDAVKRLLVDPDARVQAAAIPVACADDAPLATLLAPVADAKDPIVRGAIAEAYGERLGKPRPGLETPEALLGAVDGMWEKAAGDSLPDARLAILEAGAKAGKSDRVKAMLERGLTDKDVVVRRRAATLFRQVFEEDRTAAVGPAADKTLASYEAIVRWSMAPHAAVVTLSRPGFAPGLFTIALDTNVAPLAASNFADLAGDGFFNNRVIHRVVPNFVVQDGDPRGDGYGGPGYTIRDEFNEMAFTRGVVGMASDGKDTAGSQWFIVLSDQPHLDGRYTAFAHVVQGQRDVVSDIVPGDKVVSIRMYDGDGTEPLPKR